MADDEMQLPAAGWYVSPPKDRFVHRYWDGAHWTNSARNYGAVMHSNANYSAAPPTGEPIDFDTPPASASGAKASGANVPAPAFSGWGAKPVSERITRERLQGWARGWMVVGAIFLVLAAIGAVIIGIVAAPKTISSNYDSYLEETFRTSKTNTAAGIGIGIGSFVSALVIILPYFMIGMLMRAVAELLPEGGVPGSAGVAGVAADETAATVPAAPLTGNEAPQLLALRGQWGPIADTIWAEYQQLTPDARWGVSTEVLNDACRRAAEGTGAADAFSAAMAAVASEEPAS